MTGAPENLMSALQKIASRMTQIPQRDLREVEGMNAFFIVPTSLKHSFSELFHTHPPLEKRLARLAQIAQEMGRPVAASALGSMGLGDVLFGRKKLKGPNLDKLFALATARITLDAELGLKPSGARPSSTSRSRRASSDSRRRRDEGAPARDRA